MIEELIYRLSELDIRIMGDEKNDCVQIAVVIDGGYGPDHPDIKEIAAMWKDDLAKLVRQIKTAGITE